MIDFVHPEKKKSNNENKKAKKKTNLVLNECNLIVDILPRVRKYISDVRN